MRGLQRIRRKLQPNTTLVTVQLGTQFESNPRNYLPPRRGEMQGLASVGLYDERGAQRLPIAQLLTTAGK